MVGRAGARPGAGSKLRALVAVFFPTEISDSKFEKQERKAATDSGSESPGKAQTATVQFGLVRIFAVGVGGREPPRPRPFPPEQYPLLFPSPTTPPTFSSITRKIFSITPAERKKKFSSQKTNLFAEIRCGITIMIVTKISKQWHPRSRGFVQIC